MFSKDNRHLILVAQPDPMYVLIKVWETDTGILRANTIFDLLVRIIIFPTLKCSIRC